MVMAEGSLMDRGRVRIVLIVLALATVLVPIAARPSGAAVVARGASRPGFLVPVYAGPGDGTSTVVGSDVSANATRAAHATIDVTYTGFPTAARAAFQR